MTAEGEVEVLFKVHVIQHTIHILQLRLVKNINIGLTVEVEQVLVVTDLGHVSWGHWVGGENWSTQVGRPQVVGAHRLLLGVAVRRESPGLFCNNNTQEFRAGAQHAARPPLN